MKKPFKFKQFDIFQDRTAMKVGTDGVLLGAWTNAENKPSILDIGTGTGLISLMLAQRFQDAQINAIEIDKEAYEQAKENFLNSKFNHRLFIVNQPLQDYQSPQKFDLIVSNPPFFINNQRVEADARKKARQQDSLTFEELLLRTSQLLQPTGDASFIIPFDLEEDFLAISAKFELFPSKITRVKGNKDAEIKRSLINLNFFQAEIDYSELIIEVERHQYTKDYINLTRDFYLKM